MVKDDLSNRSGERSRRHARAKTRAPDPAKDPNRALKVAILAAMHGEVAGTGFLVKLGGAFYCSRQSVILPWQGRGRDKNLAGREQREAPISSWPPGLKNDMFDAAAQARLRALWDPPSAPAASPGKRSRERSLQYDQAYSAR